jgi:hypothetical protein
MAFPHPKSRKDNDRKEDKPNSGGVIGNVFKRTINITEYRNATDKVNPANNRTFGALVHDVVMYDFVMMSDDIVEARSMPLVLLR